MSHLGYLGHVAVLGTLWVACSSLVLLPVDQVKGGSLLLSLREKFVEVRALGTQSSLVIL
jgi:hypothetical protein